MKPLTFRLFLKFAAAALMFGGLAFSGASLGAPTLEQVRGVMNNRSIPNWKKAAAQVSAVRAAPPDANWSGYWRTLDDQLKVSESAALSRAGDPSDANDLVANAFWLRGKILADGADGRYSYAYAVVLSHIKDPDGDYMNEAATFLYHARLSLTVDSARCVDRSRAEALMAGYESQKNVQSLLEKIGQLPAAQKAIAMLEAIGIEEMRGERPRNALLCTQGDQTSLRALNQERRIQKAPAGKEEEASIPERGTKLTIETSGSGADFVADDVWKKRRREILDERMADAAKRL